MDDQSNNATLRDAAEKLALAAVGAVALTGDRAEALAEALAERGGLQRDQVRQTIEELSTRWRGEAVRVGERAGGTLTGLFREIGLVARDDFDELELRVAQLEHRVRLLEGTEPRPAAFPPTP
jgi:polyhydroxyalkanoate synthesis regulator phasin